GSNSTLSDSVRIPTEPAPIREYEIDLVSSIAVPSLDISLTTTPVTDWGYPAQFPYGPDNLPRLSDWTWWVLTASGANDTGNWSRDADGIHLDRNASWTNQSFQVFGVTDPDIRINVTPGMPGGGRSVGTGFVLNAPGYSNSIPGVPGYAQLAGAIHPALVRITLGIPGALSGWNTTTGQPTFSFRQFDKELQFVDGLGAKVLLSFPAGTWGDGNTLPSGTPVNASAPMSSGGYSGSFPTPGAMYAIVRGVANHTLAANESIAYWSIGNEVPLYSSAESVAFATVLDAAISALRPEFPNALVGADDLLDGNYLPVFASHAPGVGFLSFHWYPAGVCRTGGGSYCAPRGGNNGTTTPSLFAHPAFEDHDQLLAPQSAVAEWRNLTGRTLPVIVSELNLAASGGIGTPSQSFGTDPRQQTLVGAAWLGSLLVDASTENISAITYFGLTSATNFSHPVTYAFGGFGFGLTNETTNGSTTYFAPYWAMKLWGSFLPAGAPSIATNDSDPSAVVAFTVQNGSDLDVALVSRVATSSTIDLKVAGRYALRSTAILDGRSYAEVYDPGTNTTTITRSGFLFDSSPASSTLSIDGYGMAVLVLVPDSAGGNGSGGGGSVLGGPGTALSILGPTAVVAFFIGAIGAYLFERPRAGLPLSRRRRGSQRPGAAEMVAGV
ncbi:MAG TPA: hypothetical protein VMH90_03700, partial [Thermoplasmata archaeon]|nr:hypothetical protein [Thermoplasmata archaeon]